MTTHFLNAFFRPKAIALIGSGSDQEVLLARNLMRGGFQGPVMPVDAKRWALEGALTYADIASLPLTPTLAVITRPVQEVPLLIQELGSRGTQAALIVSDWQELSAPEHAHLDQSILDAARPFGLRVLGPGSQGFNIPAARLNVSLNHQTLLAGQIALISESGTITETALDIANHYGFGFSHLVHLGESLDVDLADLLDYLAGDARTRAVLLYIEQIGDVRKFLSAARRTARLKPVIVLKPRCFPDEPDDAVYAAAFRRAGLLRVDDSDELLQMVEVLKTAKRVRNDRLAILSNSSSMSLMATDTLYHFGGRLAQFSEATQQGLEPLVNAQGLLNPVDLGDSASARAYGQALDLLLADPGIDGVLVIKTPSAFSPTEPVAEAVIQRLANSPRAILASFPGPRTGTDARHRLLAHQAPTYEGPGAAVQAFMRMVQYQRNQALLMETPPSLPEAFSPDVPAARAILAKALADGRRQLDTHEALELLTAYGLPVIKTWRVQSPDEAAAVAAQQHEPLVLKILAPEIAHPALLGNTASGLSTPEAVQQAANDRLARLREVAPTARYHGFILQPVTARDDAYELTLGIRSGGRFGPVIYFGQGGPDAVAISDLAYGLPPLNLHLAREIMKQTRIYQRLRYSLLRRANLNALALALVKVSQMVIDLGELATLDINPLWSHAQGLLALDARIEIAAAIGDPAQRLAIRPYPKALEELFCLPDGQTLLVRPVLPEDETALHALVARAAPEDLRRRFLHPIRELTHEVAATLTQIDYYREMALVAVGPGVPGQAVVYGLVNLNTDPNSDRAEYSIMVDRKMMGLGLGHELMRRIINYARAQGISEMYGEVLQENQPMLRLNRMLGFAVHADPDEPGLKHVILKLHHFGMSAG